MSAVRIPDHVIPDGLPEDRVVAFVDILGMRVFVAEVFRSSDTTRYRELFGVIWALTVESLIVDQGSQATRATAFSDSIVFSDEYTPEGIDNVVKRVGLLSSSLMSQGVFCRGAVDAGPFHHEEGILLGPGFVSAYEMERGAAIYPRIVVSDAVVSAANEATMHGFSRLYQDFDGSWCIDVFYQLRRGTSIAEFLRQGFREREWDTQRFAQIRRNIDQQLGEAIANRKPGLIIKYRWLAQAFNDAVDRYVPNKVEHLHRNQW